MDSVSSLLRHGGVISRQNPYIETLQKPNRNFTFNTNPLRLKITSETYFNYFLFSEYQLNLVNLIESYVKIGLNYGSNCVININKLKNKSSIFIILNFVN